MAGGKEYKVPGKVQLDIKSLLLSSHPDGIPMKNFVSAYASHVGHPLKYYDMGFSNLCEFITAIPHIARIKKSDWDLNCMVVAMASAYPKNPTGVRRSPKEYYNSLHAPKTDDVTFDPEVEDLVADHNGRFSLCFGRDGLNDMTKDDFFEEFSSAGTVADVHMLEKMVFIRFNSKEELQNCLTQFKSKYNLRIGRSKKPDEGSSRLSNESNSSGRGRRDDKGANNNKRQFQRGDKNGGHKGKWDNGDYDPLKSGDKGQNNRRGLVNGNSHLNKNDLDNDSHDVSTELFAANIESEEEFKKAVSVYNPKYVRFKEQGCKKFAFLSMWNHEDALAAIRDLNQKMQSKRPLCVQFNSRGGEKHSISDNSSSMSDSVSEVSPSTKMSGHRHSTKTKTKETQGVDRDMPALETDDSDMPPLVKDTEVSDPDNRYSFDTGVIVTLFPAQTLESELRGVFKDYRVLDICVLNNGFGSGDGCTQAMLYMSTLYEAVKAVTDKNGFVLHNHKLKVLPPPNNVLLRKILVRMETGLREY